MHTPIVDFINDYTKKGYTRLHMPGHKGADVLGFEKYDITEIHGADSLYHADGIIKKSEDNATELFGTLRTFYSTEGSTHCIKSMIALAYNYSLNNKYVKSRRKIIAMRNVHKAFINACALLDLEVSWIFPGEENNSICSCEIEISHIEEVVKNEDAFALYMTSPDYLGNIYDVKKISEICHKYGKMLLVDNAHGAYLHFLKNILHPIDLGADMCSDSAHKTLPVLTGGAYLHISKNAPHELVDMAKDTMAVFGSTSPSYLILSSLDNCNVWLNNIRTETDSLLQRTIENVDELKEYISAIGFELVGNEPLKICIYSSKMGISGDEFSEILRKENIETEFSDRDFVVMMFSTKNDLNDYTKIKNAIKQASSFKNTYSDTSRNEIINHTNPPVAVKSIRESVFCMQEKIPVEESAGRICAMSVVSCPPAIPVVVSGELISEELIVKMQYYGIYNINVVVEND